MCLRLHVQRRMHLLFECDDIPYLAAIHSFYSVGNVWQGWPDWVLKSSWSIGQQVARMVDLQKVLAKDLETRHLVGCHFTIYVSGPNVGCFVRINEQAYILLGILI